MNNTKLTFRNIRLCIVFMVMALLWSSHAYAEKNEDVYVQPLFSDSVNIENAEISLVTCEPFNKVYSLYGHTGLRIHIPNAGVDIVANWGVFDMRKNFFVVRFIFGLTDYSMAIESWTDFCQRYQYYGSGVMEQVLDMSFDEKKRILAAVLENYKPENRYYRYNFLFDNCTTRARDIIEKNIDGSLEFTVNPEVESFRQLIHEWNNTHLWAQWGNDILLGVKADRKATRKECQFLPWNLKRDYDNTIVRINPDSTRHLVKASRWAVPPMYDKGENSIIEQLLLNPFGISILLGISLMVVIVRERRYRKRIWQYDAFLLMSTGILGIILFLMIFSQHPTVSLNLQILIFNPLSLIFFMPIVKKLRKGKESNLLIILSGMAFIACFLQYWQTFADGMTLLALILFIAYIRKADYTRLEQNK